MFGVGKTYGVERRAKRSRIFVVIILGIVIGALGLLGYLLLRPDTPKKNPAKEISDISTTENKPTETRLVKGKYLFNGTIVLARAVERNAAGNYAQPFSQLSSLSPQTYDAWLADLECPVTNNVVSYQQQIDNLVFNCRPEWLPEFSKYFSIVNLANNHTSDMGADGFIETQKHLDEAGLQIVGNYDPSIAKDACEVISLPVRITTTDNKIAKGELPVAFCAFHYFFRQPRPGEMDIVKEYAKVMPVFGLMHVGVEYVATAGVEQQKVAHDLIDLGSEFVIGNSPHWVQNSEVYKGKPIFYSTGNFIFDQIDYETQRGLSIDVEFNLPYDDNVAAWLELGKQCKKRADTCLQTASEQGLAKVNLELTYAPIASSGGNRRVTTKADATLQSSVEDRLGWATTKSQLAQ